MKIIKIEDGLLEQDDYLLITRTTEFLGNHVFSRADDILSLRSGYLERNFKYNEFVLIIDKKADVLKQNSNVAIYMRKDTRRTGINEIYSNSNNISATNWKIIQYDGFIQTYMSFDNKETWIATGGGQLKEYSDVQGFYVDGDVPLRLSKYRLYKNPYVRLFDIDPNYKVELVDDTGKILDTQTSVSGDIKFYLEDEVKAKFIVYDDKNTKLEETPILSLKPGDSYLNLLYEIELYYGNLLDRYSTTKLNSLNEKIQIKNSSQTDTYNDVTITPSHTNTDIIKVSLDNVFYHNSVVIPTLAPQEIKDLYISITKDKTKSSFGRRSFVLEID